MNTQAISDLFSLDGKVAIVTGATGLLGKQHCYVLRDAGAKVIACDLDAEATQAFAQELGGESWGVALNVRDRDSVTQVRDQILKKHGRVDILVNNAAINDRFEDPSLASELSKLENYPVGMWNQMLDVNVTGVFLCAQIFGTEMAKQGAGSIINIASTYGVVAPDQSLYRDEAGKQHFYKSPAYPATKGAVVSLTRFLAAYWGEKGVRVNTLSPGGVENSQDEYFVRNYSRRTPLGRMAKPNDYRGAILFLASEASSYVTGANFLVDGGWTIW